MANVLAKKTEHSWGEKIKEKSRRRKKKRVAVGRDYFLGKEGATAGKLVIEGERQFVFTLGEKTANKSGENVRY